MTDDHLKAVGDSLKGTILLGSIARLHRYANSALEEKDSLTAIILTHSAFECLLRECLNQLTGIGAIVGTGGKKLSIKDYDMPGLIHLAVGSLLTNAQESDLIRCNMARNHAYHHAIPPAPEMAGKLVELTEQLLDRLALSSGSQTSHAGTTRSSMEESEGESSGDLYTGRAALLVALAQHKGELSAGELYDEAEELSSCQRSSLYAMRDQLEQEGLILYISTRDTYKLSREGRQELEDLVE